jgi:hypothetical protein
MRTAGMQGNHGKGRTENAGIKPFSVFSTADLFPGREEHKSILQVNRHGQAGMGAEGPVCGALPQGRQTGF